MATYIIHECVDGGGLQNGGRGLARASDGRFWAVFLDRPAGYSFRQVLCAYSDDGGVTWTVEQVTDDDTADHRDPTIAVDSSDSIHIVYHRLVAGQSVLFYMRRNGGWGPEETVSQVAGASQVDGKIAIDSQDDVHVVWDGGGEGANPGFRQIKYKKKTSGSWGSTELVTDIADTQWAASVAIDSEDNVHVVWRGVIWEDHTGYWQVTYRKRTTSWQAIEAVSDIGDSCYYLCIALDSDDVPHVVWQGRGILWPTGSHAVNYKNRIGGSWSALEVVAEDEDGNSQQGMSIALDRDNNVHVAWTGRGLGLADDTFNIRRIVKTGDGWQTRIDITTETAVDNWYPCLLWAMWPEVGGVRTNVPTADRVFLVWWYYQDDVRFYTFAVIIPTVTTDPATLISQVSATLNGTLTADGGEPCECGFQWGLTDAYGHTTLTESKVTGESSSRAIGGLTPGTTYHFRTFATNSAGTGYGADRSFISTPTFNRAYALSREEL